ncbi:MAG: Do family serine endopeptidase [Bryobacteraceae bacterium]
MAKEIQFRRSTAILTLLAASLGGGVIAAFMVASRSGAPVQVAVSAAGSGASAAAPAASYADMLEKVTPAVVSIYTTQVIKGEQQMPGIFNDPFFQQFFGQGFGRNMKPRNQTEHGLGSGVIISKDGYILTNNHVIDKASDIQVQLLDGRKIKAKLVGTDKDTDIAVVKITEQDLPTISFADSTKARVGDLVFAIGNPFDVGQTVTMGIISAKSRAIGGIEKFEDFIQTDAAINPGNSGGALVNANGALVGINTAILANGSEGNQGIGFAIPVNLARNVMEQLEKGGKVTRGFIGVGLEDITPDLKQAMNLPTTRGALVREVEPGKPGAKAGLKVGDVITAVDGQTVLDPNGLTIAVIQMQPGQVAHLDVLRNGEKMKIDVTLTARPNEETARGQFGGNNEGGGNSGNNALEGVTVETLTPDIAQQVQVPPSTKGVVVDSVDDDSPAANAQPPLQRGDVITQVDRQPVTNASEYDRLVSQAKGKSVLLYVNRQGSNIFVVVPSK